MADAARAFEGPHPMRGKEQHEDNGAQSETPERDNEGASADDAKSEDDDAAE